MIATQNSNLTIVIGLVGNSEEHRKTTEGQVSKTIGMLLRFGNMPISRGSKKTNCIISGLEDVPMSRTIQEISVYNLNFDLELNLDLEREKSKTKPKNVVSSEPGDSNSQDYNSVVIHICDHHTPNGGFRAGGDLFYDTKDIAKALVKIISNYKFENLHLVLHSCKTAVKCPKDDSTTMQKLLNALCSELDKEEQKSPLSISIYGVEYKISENSSGQTAFQLTKTRPNGTVQKLEGGRFTTLPTKTRQNGKFEQSPVMLTKESAESEGEEAVPAGAVQAEKAVTAVTAETSTIGK